MWIIKNGKKEEYDPTEVYATKTDWGTYVVTIADRIRKSSVIVYETSEIEEATIVRNAISMKIKGKIVKMYIDKNKVKINLTRET